MIYENKKINSSFELIHHKSGLTIILSEMPKFNSAYALFATRCGSIDDNFRKNDKETFQKVPAGIAHFLEHKLFESEEGDAFDEYAKYGANANAFTSFDKTAYLFSCTDNFKESLKVLLNLVTHPYFTKENVEKEQGIIGQEIKMYDDSPDWRVFFNLVESLYQNHPLKLDIAGTVESISDITAETLYKCYDAFYNLNNMVLSIAGKFKKEDVLELCDEILKPAENFKVETMNPNEPKEIVRNYAEQSLEVSSPICMIGFKGISKSYKENIINSQIGDIALDLIAGPTTSFYTEMYDSGLINPTFSAETMAGPSYLCTMFSGESHNPKLLYEKFLENLENVRKNGITDEAFNRAKKSVYGRLISQFADVEAMAMLMMNSTLSGINPYDQVDMLSTLTKKDLENYILENLDAKYSALSVIKGKN